MSAFRPHTHSDDHIIRIENAGERDPQLRNDAVIEHIAGHTHEARSRGDYNLKEAKVSDKKSERRRVRAWLL